MMKTLNGISNLRPVCSVRLIGHAGGALSEPDTISVALYLLLLGVALPMLGFAGGWQDGPSRQNTRSR